MKICEQCGAQLNDNTTFCTKCGAKMERTENEAANGSGAAGAADEGKSGSAWEYSQGASERDYQSAYNAQAQNHKEYTYQQYDKADPYDHTSEFDKKDIADNKVVAMLIYLLGVVGIVIGLIAGCRSDYAAFHARQAMKFKVVSVLLGIVAGLLFWTFVIPIVAVVLRIALWVCKVIAFFSVCGGKACEPYIVRNLDFLR